MSLPEASIASARAFIVEKADLHSAQVLLSAIKKADLHR